MHWADVQRAGGALVLQADGTFRLRRGALTADQIRALQPDRPQIIAEWLWRQPDAWTPVRLAWDAAVAQHVLRIGVALMAGGPWSGLAPPAAPAVDAAQQAVDAAWQAENLFAVLRATQAWVRSVAQGWTDSERASRLNNRRDKNGGEGDVRNAI